MNMSLTVSYLITIDKERNIARLNSLVDPVHLQLILATSAPTNSFHESISWGLSGMTNFPLRIRLRWHMNWTLFISLYGSIIGFGN